MLLEIIYMCEAHNAIFVTQKRASLLALVKLYYLSKFGLRRKPVN